ncbi:efflux RND transporter permease subunit [Rheinheimera tilapiae]|uniref:Efflux RND transporter permease subunit n=1 Tax=Rheinheimera tilapiae TaxID=875043 RepID=A0ABV6BC92_9GAMM
MNIARYSMAKRTSLWVLVLIILFGGYLSYQQLGRFEDPEFIIRKAVIATPYPGASAREVADEVTDLIERSVQSLQEVKQVKSVSSQGMSEVTVEIDLRFARTSAELDQVWDKLRRKIGDAQRGLPKGAGPAVVNDDFADVYALFYAITGPGYSDRQLYDYVDFLSKELAMVAGVAKTAVLANRQEEIYLEFSAARLAALGMTAQQLYGVLQKQNLVATAGELSAGQMRIPVRPAAAVDSFAALQQLPVAVGPNGKTLALSDVATISRASKEPAGLLVTYNGERAIGLGVSNIKGGNVVAMGDAVKARLAELESQRPVGMELNQVSVQSESVKASVASFVDNLIAAVLIVFIVLLFFMGFRAGVIIGFVLLLTVAGTLIIMLIDDIAMQRISLGALIIALGMLVDNAIVVTDGVIVKLQQGEEAEQAISDVVAATIWPLLGGTLVGILAFSAIGLSPSDMGEYAGSLFWVILYSMLLSWIFAVTVTPMLCQQFLTVKPQNAASADSRIMRWYRQLLEQVLRYRLLSGVILLVLFVLAVFGMRLVPPGFMPESQRAQFVVDLYLPQGTSIEQTAATTRQIAADVAQHSGVTHITSFAGGGGLRFMLSYSPEARNPAYGQLLVDVSDHQQISAMVSLLQRQLSAAYPDVSIKVWKFMLGRGGGKKIEAGFSGPDPKVLRVLAEQAKGVMLNTPGLIAVQDDWRQQVPVLVPVYDTALMQQLGLTHVEINQALQQTLNGNAIGSFRDGHRLIPIVVRAPASERTDDRLLDTVQVTSPLTQKPVPLSSLTVSSAVQWQDAMIRRIDRQPTILVQADPAPDVLTNEALALLRPQIEAIDLPAGYQLTWYGEYKASNDANQGIASSAPLGFAAMILTVVLMFNAVRPALVIWLTVPLAIVGVVIGLVAFNTPFEFMAILGFLSLIGMMVKNAIVLVDEADHNIKAGLAPFLAVIQASVSRARPVVLGALTTILGVAPLILDPFFKSMAVTIMFGLLFATALTLVVIPLLYAVLLRIPSPQPE